MAGQGQIDLYYGDESQFSSEGYVPYGWQFPEEKVCVLVEKGFKINALGLISRQNACHWATTDQNIDSQFIRSFLDNLSLNIRKETVVVLDNARVHAAKIIQECIPTWQHRGLFILLLPPYSPHLNIAETLWRKLKKEWINPQDYLTKDSLGYAVNRCMANIGQEIVIKFSPFNLN